MADRHFGERLGTMELEIELDQPLAIAIDQKAAGERHMFASESLAQIAHRDAQSEHRRGIELDANGAAALAADDHLPHPVDGLETLLDDVAGVAIELL